MQGQRGAGLPRLLEPLMIVIRAVIFDTRCNRANATSVGHPLRPGQPMHHVQKQLMVLLRPRRVHAHLLLSWPGQLRAKHRRLAEHRDPSIRLEKVA